MSFQNLFCDNLETDTINGVPVGGGGGGSVPGPNTIYTSSCIVPMSAPQAGRLMNNAGNEGAPSGVSNVLSSVTMVRLDPSDYPVINGITPQLRLIYIVSCNDFAPECNFTLSLNPIIGSSGFETQMAFTRGSTISPLITIITPTETQTTILASGVFPIPPVDLYCFVVLNSGVPLSLTTHTAQLQVVYF